MFATRALRSVNVPEGERVTKVLIVSEILETLNTTEFRGHWTKTWLTKTHARLLLHVLNASHRSAKAGR